MSHPPYHRRASPLPRCPAPGFRFAPLGHGVEETCASAALSEAGACPLARAGQATCTNQLGVKTADKYKAASAELMRLMVQVRLRKQAARPSPRAPPGSQGADESSQEQEESQECSANAPLDGLDLGAPVDEAADARAALATEMDRFLRHDFRPALTAACGSLGRGAMLALDLGKFIHSEDFRSMFPNIFVVARSVLCLVPASCQPESVFSTTRWTLGTYCHNLGPEATEARVILHRVAQEFDSVVDASRHAMRQAGSAGCEPHSSQTTPLRAGVSRAGVRPPPSDLPGLDCM